MLLVTLRDLQWRKRRYFIAVIAAGLAFALSLIMDGTLQAMRNESDRIVALYDADQWLVAPGSNGPFTSTQFLPEERLDELRSQPGVEHASPMLVVRSAVGDLDVNVVGYEPGGITQPSALVDGEATTEPGVATVDTMLGVEVGDTVTIAGRSFPVGAVTERTTFYFGMPTVFLPIDDVQDTLLAGEAVASAIVVRGELDAAPAGLTALSDAQVGADLDRVLAKTAQTLGTINALLWVMAAGIIAALVYITVLERLTDLAVLKATGATSGALVTGLVAQAAVLAAAAAVIASLLAQLLGPAFSFAVEIPDDAYVQLVVIAAVVGGVASLAGLRRILTIDPALVFGASA